jgi:diguanylate cyclase (GGDEF)-like protein
LSERQAAERRQSAHVRYQEKIARLGQSALGMRQASELVLDAAQSVLEGLAADAVAYLEPGTKDGTVIVREVLGLAEEPARAVAEYGRDDPLAAVLQHGAAVVLENAEHSPLPFAWAVSASSAALVPVSGEQATRGAFCALSRRPGAFGPEEMRFIEAAASVLSSGLQRIDSEGRLAYLAQFDTLTGLPNRALLADRFSQMIVHARRHAKQLGVLFIDLDDFKLVNDALGHAAGDELLREVANRLKRSVRLGDTVARISGDEFAAVLADLAQPDDAAIVAQKIIDALAAPIHVHGQEVFAAASIGIASFPADGDDAETLLGAADAAMYRAKESQRSSYQFFTAEINQRSRARAQLSSELRRALERDEFCLFYQPKMDLRTGGVCGAEALLRWKHPERGLVPPVQFIPVLEETGLIVPVGEWVIKRACDDMKSWTAAGIRVLPIAVNLSARQFRQPDLDVRIRALIEAAGVNPELIELEITESQLMHDPQHAIRVLRELREAGIRIALDDFGTGYSSLAYLTRFPLAALKIDRSFVADVLIDEADATIVRTIVDMAKQLGFTVVAEGVETQEQAAFLKQLGCEQAQGYLFAKPMPASELHAFLGRAV